MSRAEAAARLGAITHLCVKCRELTRHEDAILISMFSYEHLDDPGVSSVFVCSTHCANEYASGRLVALHAYHWSPANECWKPCGRYVASSRWNWSATAEAKQLIERAEALRAAGEIS